MSYADDLKHPLWQKCRLRVLEAARWRCARCGDAERQLHAHHKAYIRGRRPWEYPQDMLECLCDPCHTKAHAERNLLDLAIAKRPTSELPALARVIDRLAGVLQDLQGMVVLSGYPCELYDRELFVGWERHQRTALADGARERTEVVWLNPACSAALQRSRGGLFAAEAA